MHNDFIGPLLRVRLYHSNGSRDDLGLAQFKILNTRETLAPEVTLLKHLNVYAGAGIEQVLVYSSRIDPSAEKSLQSSNNYYINSFAEARLKFDPVPIRIGNRIDKYLIFTYTEYLTGNSSNEIKIQGVYDAEFSNLSVLSLKSKMVLLFNNPPFYHNEGISDQYFKGFSSESYYSNKEISLSGEYRFSIYQDFLYVGGFVDAVLFEPAGYKLSGTKIGLISGVTGRVLIYDQFELIAYFGIDRLFPDDRSGTNLRLKLTKKW